MSNSGNNHNYSIYFSASFAVILLGMIIDYMSYPKLILLPQYPVNLYIIGSFLIATILVYYVVDRKHRITSKFYSIESAIASVSALTVLVLLMGFIPQKDEPHSLITRIGLTHITGSWAYILVSFHFLIVLTFTIYKRIIFPLKLKNVAFFVNHAGLWIVIVTASLGAGDLKRLYIYIQEGETANVAIGGNNKMHKIPFTITLHDFQMEEYPPKIGIFSQETGYIVPLKNENNPKTVQENMTMKVDSWTLEVEEYFNSSIRKDSSFVKSELFGSYPSARIKISKDKMKISRYKWLAVGNPHIQKLNIPLSNKYIVSLLAPTAKRYLSKVTIKQPDNEVYNGDIEVNKPYKYQNWKIYQTGYDTKLGKYSKLSILELVYDPWLPYVYVGIFMLILGSLFFVFFGKYRANS